MLIFQLVSPFQILELKYLDTLIIDTTVTADYLTIHKSLNSLVQLCTASACFVTQDSSTVQMFSSLRSLWLVAQILELK